MWSSLLLVGVVYRRVHGSRHVLVDRGPHRLRGVGALGFLPRRLSLGPAVLRPAHRRRLLGSFVHQDHVPDLQTWKLGIFPALRVQGGMGIAFAVPGVRLIRALDVAVAVWVVAWVVLALLVGREVRDLRELSDTVVVAGVAVEETGDLVDSLGSVPFVGGSVGEVADRVRTAGRSAQASGRDSRDSTQNLSILLALSIGLIPTLPLLGLYAPLRVTWTREARAVRRTLAAGSPDPVLKEFLARRAVLNLPYQELRTARRARNSFRTGTGEPAA